MNFSHISEEISLISKGLYASVIDVIGKEDIIKIRREKNNITEIISSCVTKDAKYVISGSMGEGFYFKSSDNDIMVCNAKTVVLHMDLCHILDLKDIPLVLLMETEKVSPGFTLLRCLRFNYREVGLVLIGTDMYLSSKVIRESYNPGCSSNLHGPCRTFNVYKIEYDYAYTLQCSIWPRQAMSFIYRSLNNGWPCYDVLTDICNDGCLLVPINSKQQVYSEPMDLEWRISFSLAEKKLIHSMNHCQFLTYGLMKIFLNEVLKKIPEAEDLLCSYFMKTAVFWEISECSDHWSPSKFLVKFWNVFSRIIKWVSFGYCPNFFIPEHNMFFGKIYGRQQRDLMLRLRLLFDEGCLCLLRCHSLHESLSLIFQYPLLTIAMPIALHLFPFESPQSTIEEEKIKMVSASIGCFLHGYDVPQLIKTLGNTIALLPSFEEGTSALRDRTLKERTSALKLRICFILQKIALVIHPLNSSLSQSSTSNIKRYCRIKTSELILMRTRTWYSLNITYHAVCSYRNGEYNKTIRIINKLKGKLQRLPYMYCFHLDGNFIAECRQHGISYETIVKSFVIFPFVYEPETHIDELFPEIHTIIESSQRNFFILPPLVLINFLLFLSYTYSRDVFNRNKVLGELETLVSSDKGYHIHLSGVAISWEILGICQQKSGNLHGAYQSYTKALSSDYNDFKLATIYRLTVLVFEMQKRSNNSF